MMDKEHLWTVSDVLAATGGHLVSGDPQTPTVGVSTDTRSIHEGELFIAISGERYDGHQFVKTAYEKGAMGVIVSEAYTAEAASGPEKDKCWVAVSDTLKALGDLAAFRRRQSQVSVVAITGTNGKTTTKEMTASVLGEAFSVLKTSGNFNNLIGLPLTLFGLREDHDWAVLELAMNRPGEIARLAEI
ncbi:MAG: Mur ligase family protein, partial [Thermodesulfobacteriota bacterium]|nr:Mur ligase family protein [Thermodesulfobacteriota bacterium]